MEPIAIVGMACRFPGGGDNPDAFWRLLINRVDAIREIGDDRWSKAYYYHPDRNAPGKTYCKHAGQLKDIYHFEPEFFGISPREAIQLDPQQRLLLELTWEALEEGGHIPAQLAGSDCSVYVGISSLDYANVHHDDPGQADSYFMTGNTLSLAANRISHFLDLHGASVAIDTACSSFLVALHHACAGIWEQGCQAGIAGSAHLLFSPFPNIGFSKASMLSADGKCYAFDARANGYVRSEGGAVFYLKPLSRAEADGDPIHALILGTGVNTDGGDKALTVPDSRSQQALLEGVYRTAGIDIADIVYIEAHGTGTPVGDPVEAHAIGHGLGVKRDRANPVLIGSVKSNIGHLEPASGAAGLMKLILCLQHRGIPPSINFDVPNANIDFDGLNLKLVTDYLALDDIDKPLMMGVNSFGFGGSNAHALLSEYRRKKCVKKNTNIEFRNLPLLLSAHSPESLQQRAAQFHQLLSREASAQEAYDLFYTAARHRQRLRCGLVAYGDSLTGIMEELKNYSLGQQTQKIITSEGNTGVNRVAFVFSGNGSQWQGMGQTLLALPEFSAAVAEIDGIFQPLAAWSIAGKLTADAEYGGLDYTEVAQPALFAIQVGLLRVMRNQGLEPDMVFGHSIGEVAAAYAAGILSLEQATRIVYFRSEAQSRTRGMGKMAAAQLSAQGAGELIASVGKGLELAAINSPNSVTLTGSEAALEMARVLLEEERVFCRILDLDYAFHSRAMDSVKDGFLNRLGAVTTATGNRTFISTVTGRKRHGGELDAEYWWHNLRAPVRFGDAVLDALDEGAGIFVEIGPHPVLKTYIHECLRSRQAPGKVISTLKRNAEDEHDLVRSAAYEAMLLSGSPALEKAFTEPGNIVSLPPYPWNRTEYRINRSSESVNRKLEHPLLGYRSNSIDGVWQQQIDLATHPYLKDHVVNGVVVFPAAAFTEMAIAASCSRFDRACHEIANLEIRRPLILEAGVTKDLQFILSADDLRFSIKSRNRLSEQPWNLHVVGNLVNDASPCGTHHYDPDKLRAHAEQQYGREAVYTTAARLGFDYGEHFQGVDAVWKNKNVYLSRIDFKDTGKGLPGDQYILGPDILDAALHTIFPALVSYLDDTSTPVSSYLPMGIGNFRIHTDFKPVEYCVAEILERSTRSIRVRFSLMDADGGIVACMDDCIFKQILSFSPHQHTPKFYNYIRIPHNHIDGWSVAPLPGIDELEQSVINLPAVHRLQQREQVYYEQVLPLLDALALSIAEESLLRLGAHRGEFSIDSLLTSSGIGQEHERFFIYLLNLLEEDGRARRRQDSWELSATDEGANAALIWRAIIADYPEYIDDMLQTVSHGFRLPETLTSPSSAGDPSLKSHSCLKPDETAVQVITQLIHFISEQWPRARRRLRIALIIDGMSSLPRQLIKSLPREYCDLHILVGDDSVQVKAAQQLACFSNVKVDRFDLSDDKIENEFIEGEFDVLISLNALFKCRDILKGLSRLSYLSASGGLLLLAEQAPGRLVDVNLGMMCDWWSRTTDMERPVSLLMEAGEWFSALEAAGFRDGRLMTETIGPTARNFVIAATRPVRGEQQGEVRTQSRTQSGHPWLLVCNQDGESAYLADALQTELARKGIKVFVAAVATAMSDSNERQDRVLISNQDDYIKLLEVIQKEYLYLDNIVFLSGIDMETEIPASQLLDQHCHTHMQQVHLLNAMQVTTSDAFPRLYLMTKNTMQPLSGTTKRQVNKQVHKQAGNPSQASLWGIGRVLRNEYPDIDCKQIDLQLGDNMQRICRAIIREINHADEENEIILSEGTREVLRLQEQDPPLSPGIVTAEEGAGDAGISRLEIPFPGALDRLEWRPSGRLPLGADEVELQVMATGLNFRDVMYASGLLPDEILENGFAGPTLGLECAGIVTRIGEDVGDFKVDDRAMAFGPACFASHVVTKANAAVAKPEHWSFEEAAATPTAFFTVYYALKYLAGLRRGERILIHGAAGGVGLAAIQYARHCGAEIFATAGTQEKRDFLELLGVEHVLDSRTLRFADAIMKITDGEGVDVVLNSLAGEAIDKNFSVLKPFGRFLELGKRDFLENRHIGLRPFRNNISYHGIDVDQLMLYQPQLTGDLFREMMALFEQGSFRPLPFTVFPRSDVSSAFKYMQQSHHVGKIVISGAQENRFVAASTTAASTTVIPAIDIKNDSSYLVSGGLSGFGLATAAWLATKGAGHLILLGRGGPREDVAGEIERIKSLGCGVTVKQCDVSDAPALKKVLAEIDATLPPLKGIVHAAMVLDDGLFKNLSEESLRAVFKPKVQGAWNLHELTLGHGLDLFILYSSATTYIGNPGQANYVAANSYLEALARYRQARGLPALAMAWDAIMDTGYLARNDSLRESFSKRLGINGINTGQAFSALEQALVAGDSGPALMNANWKSMRRLLPIISSPTYDFLTHNITDDEAEGDSMDFAEMIRGLSQEEIHILITRLLTDEVAKILQMPKEKVEHNRAMQDLGLDSLMGLELVTAIENRFNIEIPVMSLSDNSTIDSLAARLTRMATRENAGRKTPGNMDDDKDAELFHSMAQTHAEAFSHDNIDKFAEQFNDDKKTIRRVIK